MSGGIGGVASRPGSRSLSEDHRRPARTTAAGGERRNPCVPQDRHQVVIRPSKRRNVHGSEQGVHSSEAGPPLPISPPGQPAAGRTLENQKTGRPPYNRPSTTEREDSLAGFEKVGDLEAYAVSLGGVELGGPSSYVDLDEVLHEGPSIGVSRENDQDAEPSEGAPENPPAPEDPKAPEDPQSPEDPHAPGQLPPKDL